ncbi:hypothetical protein QVG61_12005 [Thiohalobacter sp. IOR34]|uniref:hypothetical protein n=1 Tax=Thiohalobacter sp. IOR34 TaxID=3057176 RepID=UPI0025AFE820|nr:hypothetical protein [Thiohalobacter sp. IOR34]WJW75201.1 hypothetical protein QVG61_12005 [Thiohalobacter sp. IOR34]
MGLEIKLTDTQIKPSKDFIDFLFRLRSGEKFKENWFDQLSERLKPGSAQQVEERLRRLEGQHLADPVIKEALLKSYNLTVALLIGETAMVKRFLAPYRFIFVVGCPRSGGSYLTKQAYMALGHDPERIPGLIAHDGFPKAWPFYIGSGHNQHTDMARYLAEYLVMVELFFAHRENPGQHTIIPKKDINAAYHGAFFNQVLGQNTEYILTIRHPATSCISTYEKSGGLPENRKFAVRSTIESFIQRDNTFTGADAHDLLRQDYFDVYLRYWEQYHYNLALTGLCTNRQHQVVAYTRDSMIDSAQAFYSRFSSDGSAEPFKVFNKKGRHPNWIKKAENAIYRVRDVWKLAGLDFPLEEIMEVW